MSHIVINALSPEESRRERTTEIFPKTVLLEERMML